MSDCHITSCNECEDDEYEDNLPEDWDDNEPTIVTAQQSLILPPVHTVEPIASEYPRLVKGGLTGTCYSCGNIKTQQRYERGLGDGFYCCTRCAVEMNEVQNV